jgi:hypothetical protein
LLAHASAVFLPVYVHLAIPYVTDFAVDLRRLFASDRRGKCLRLRCRASGATRAQTGGDENPRHVLFHLKPPEFPLGDSSTEKVADFRTTELFVPVGGANLDLPVAT